MFFHTLVHFGLKQGFLHLFQEVCATVLKLSWLCAPSLIFNLYPFQSEPIRKAVCVATLLLPYGFLFLLIWVIHYCSVSNFFPIVSQLSWSTLFPLPTIFHWILFNFLWSFWNLPSQKYKHNDQWLPSLVMYMIMSCTLWGLNS